MAADQRVDVRLLRSVPTLTAFLLLLACGAAEPARDAGRRAEDAGPDVSHPAKLRALQVTRLPGAEPTFLLSDPYRYTEKNAVLSGPGYYASTLFDGRRSAGDVALQVEVDTGARGGSEEVRTLARELEEGLLLDSARFRRRKAEVDSAWTASKHRPIFHFGDDIPREPEALAKVLGRFFSGVEAPRGEGKLVAAVAPHVDPRSGGPTYAPAYRAIAAEAADADLFVLLGTGHPPLEGTVALTSKDYETPFGVVETDRDALAKVAAALGTQAFANEWAHRTEHSLEFTAVFLAYALRGVRTRPIRALPILVGHFPDGEDGVPRPDDAADAGALVEALREIRREREVAGRRVVFVAGVDLAHRGVRFGDAAVSAADLPPIEAQDRVFAQRALAGDAAGALADYARDRGARRYCGLAPLWVLASVLGPSRGDVVRTGHDLTAGAVVTFFSGTMRQ